MSNIGNKEVFSKNLTKYIDESGKTRMEICQALGIAYSTFSEWANGRKYPRIDKIEMIANYFGVKKSDLIEQNGIDSNIGEIMSKDKIRMIPVFESVSAGFGASASEYIVNYIPLYIEHDYDAENTLAIKVVGNSMYPKIEDGDLIAVRKQSDFENGQVVVVLIDGEEGLVKKIYQDKNKITLVSFNPEYPDKVFIGEEINRLSIVGVVKQVIKTL